METFPILKVPVTFEEHLTSEGRNVPAWVEYITNAYYGGYDLYRTFELKYQEVIDQDHAVATNVTSPSGGSITIGGSDIAYSGIGLFHGIPVHAEDSSVPSTASVTRRKATRWVKKSFDIGQHKYGQAIQCIALFALVQSEFRLRYYADEIDKAGFLVYLQATTRTRKAAFQGRVDHPTFQPASIMQDPGQTWAVNPNQTKRFTRSILSMVLGSVKYKLHEDHMEFECEFENQHLTRDVIFEFGVLVDSYFGHVSTSNKLPIKATFYDGMLGFGPT
ncbi:hypothetical protein C0992_008624 [Termitomyces sp. T32_za158]|nr:hypothetical protein C0992_008624 [Termitomyces sp. T32_za158]